METVNTIKEQVEQRLQEKQANKEFKDIGRVANTKKERAAFRLIDSSILSELEQDSVMAFNMVKKEAVWSEIDINAERERGVTSGAAFLKVKIREAVPTKPADNASKRAAYVIFLEKLQNDLAGCYNVEQIEELTESYKKMPIGEVIGLLVDKNYIDATDEQKLKIEGLLKQNRNLGIALLYGSSRLFPKLINEIFSAKFENILLRKSDAAILTWQEAKQKEPITQDESGKLIEKINLNEEKNKEANQLKIDSYKEYTIPQLKDRFSDWSFSGSSKVEYKNNPELFRAFAIRYYTNIMEKQKEVYENKKKAAQPKDNDWSWFETPKEREKSDKAKKKRINTKEPLSYIKRTGGYKIDRYTQQGIIDRFGFSSVNYGNYVDDAWSKEHTKHFLGAICDLGDILNFDIKKMNQLGKLSIAFGAKGIGGHAATYFPQTKDINLTKGNGDGSVAHEWGHYFDNVIVELDIKRATNNFASEGTSPDEEIKMLYKELFDFIHKGNSHTPKVPMTFFAQKADSPPTYSVRNGYSSESKKIEIKATIEETLAELDRFAIVNENWYYTQKRLFGYVIDAFGLESYDVPMKLETSYFYHSTKYDLFKLCVKTADGKIITVSEVRTKYWTSSVELFARAWETVVLKKLLDKGRVSNYLVDDIPVNIPVSEGYNDPYPQGTELAYIETMIDKIVAAVKRKFEIGDFVPPSDIYEDDFIEFKKNGTGETENAMVIEEPKDSEIETVKFIEEEKVVEEFVSNINEQSDAKLDLAENKIEEVGEELKNETYNEFYKSVSERQSKVSYLEFAKNPPKFLYREYYDGEIETWEYRVSLNLAFSAGYRLLKHGKAKEYLLRQAYNLYKKGELLSEKFEEKKEVIEDINSDIPDYVKEKFKDKLTDTPYSFIKLKPNTLWRRDNSNGKIIEYGEAPSVAPLPSDKKEEPYSYVDKQMLENTFKIYNSASEAEKAKLLKQLKENMEMYPEQIKRYESIENKNWAEEGSCVRLKTSYETGKEFLKDIEKEQPKEIDNKVKVNPFKADSKEDYTAYINYWIKYYDKEIASGKKDKETLIKESKDRLIELNKTKRNERFERFYKEKAILEGVLKHYEIKKQPTTRKPRVKKAATTPIDKFNKGRSKKAIADDAKWEALPTGKRVSASGKVYYENRPDHADIEPSKKLKSGGKI